MYLRVILQQEDALPDQIFDVQEYMGEPFIEVGIIRIFYLIVN